jgi:hypothetical protein
MRELLFLIEHVTAKLALLLAVSLLVWVLRGCG